MSDGYQLKDSEVVEMEIPEIVPAGGESIEDSVITGTMNYYVQGVKESEFFPSNCDPYREAGRSIRPAPTFFGEKR